MAALTGFHGQPSIAPVWLSIYECGSSWEACPRATAHTWDGHSGTHIVWLKHAGGMQWWNRDSDLFVQ